MINCLLTSEIYKNDLESIKTNLKNIEMLKNKSIFITGSTGLIGSALIDFLIYLNIKDNYNIKIYGASRNVKNFDKRFSRIKENRSLNHIYFDLNKTLDFSGQVDYVIHAASNAHPNAYITEPIETMMCNIIGTNNVLNFSVKNKINRVIYISSSEVYGLKENELPYTETNFGFLDILNARACYPSSKRASETLCASFIKQYDLDVLIARPGHIYGPTITEQDSRASAQFTRKALNGENIVLKSAGLQIRSYCYVFDCVSALLTILIKGKTGEAYNISNKNSIVTIKELAEQFAIVGGTKVIFKKPNKKELESYNLMSNSSLNAEKLESLGWHGIYNIKSGVNNTISILKESLNFSSTVF